MKASQRSSPDSDPAARRATPNRRRKPAGRPPAGNGGQPLYLRIASELRRGIAEGRYPVGSHLPTEFELWGQFRISRFTARAAVRVLASAGLITRRQRVGTVVVATPDDARYSHSMSSLRDLGQYAQDTELRFVYIGKLALTKALAREFGAQPGAEWIYAMGVRRESANGGRGQGDGRPICITRLYLNRMLEPNGLKDGYLDLVYAGASSARLRALESGAVDAAILTAPFNFYGASAGLSIIGRTADWKGKKFAMTRETLAAWVER